MIKVKSIDHVAIAVADAQGAEANLCAFFGLERGAAEHVASQQTDVIFLHPGGSHQEAAIELVCPSGNQGLERFLARRGPGLHHVCFEVDDLAASLATLKAAGVALVDEAPRQNRQPADRAEV